MTGGGGGYGNAFDRPPEEVIQDFLNDYISRDVAREEYGVVLTADGSGYDEVATNELRNSGR